MNDYILLMHNDAAADPDSRPEQWPARPICARIVTTDGHRLSKAEYKYQASGHMLPSPGNVEFAEQPIRDLEDPFE